MLRKNIAKQKSQWENDQAILQNRFQYLKKQHKNHAINRKIENMLNEQMRKKKCQVKGVLQKKKEGLKHRKNNNSDFTPPQFNRIQIIDNNQAVQNKKTQAKESLANIPDIPISHFVYQQYSSVPTNHRKKKKNNSIISFNNEKEMKIREGSTLEFSNMLIKKQAKPKSSRNFSNKNSKHKRNESALSHLSINKQKDSTLKQILKLLKQNKKQQNNKWAALKHIIQCFKSIQIAQQYIDFWTKIQYGERLDIQSLFLLKNSVNNSKQQQNLKTSTDLIEEIEFYNQKLDSKNGKLKNQLIPQLDRILMQIYSQKVGRKKFFN